MGLMQQPTKYAEQLNGERSVAPFIPYSSHVGPTTLLTRDGDVLRVWKIDGIPFETTDEDTLERRKDQLNTLMRSIGSTQTAVWVHNVRRKVTDKLDSHFPDDFSRELDKKYYESFKGYRMMANELYVTLLYRPSPSMSEKMAKRSARRSTDQIKDDLKRAIRKLDELSYQIEAGFKRYGFEVLGTYQDKDVDGKEYGPLYSSALEFFNFLITGEWQKVRVPNGPLFSYLGNAYIYAGIETMEIRSPLRTRSAQLIDFKDYPEWSEVGLLDDLMYEESEYVMTHSFSFMSGHDGKKFLEKQRNQLRAAEDGSVTQIVQMDVAIDELIQGRFLMGEYHFSLMMFGDTREKLERNVASAMAVLKDRGFLAVKIATAIDAAFYAQLPGNWQYRPRIAGINSLNFAGLIALHNFAAGKRDGNPWGQAVTLFKSPSMQPFYFNFHYSKDGEDATDKKVLGNTRIIGQSGSGKTVLMNFLVTQLGKYATTPGTNFTLIYFDKDRGAELAIRAVGGKYHAIKNGTPTNFNVMKMDPTERNIVFATQWIAMRCRGEPDAHGNYERLSASELDRINHAVRTVFRMPRELRGIQTVLQNMTQGVTREERDNSLVKRLEKWAWGNSLGWVADCPEDTIDFDTHRVHGIDGTDFLDNADVCTAISSYLLHRMEDSIAGRRFVYLMDEAWKWVNDRAFSEFAGNKQLTIRKQNGFGVFATQMPSSLLESEIGSALVQQCATEIYLPNPKADHDEYVNGFKLTETEFEAIKDFGEESRLFLVKQGHNSAIVRLDLAGFDDELAILSGSTDNIELLDSIMEEVGEDPRDWMPVFHERRHARAMQTRRA